MTTVHAEQMLPMVRRPQSCTLSRSVREVPENPRHLWLTADLHRGGISRWIATHIDIVPGPSTGVMTYFNEFDNDPDCVDAIQEHCPVLSFSVDALNEKIAESDVIIVSNVERCSPIGDSFPHIEWGDVPIVFVSHGACPVTSACWQFVRGVRECQCGRFKDRCCFDCIPECRLSGSGPGSDLSVAVESGKRVSDWALQWTSELLPTLADCRLRRISHC